MNGFTENNFTTMANARVAQRIEMSGRQYLELLDRFVNITGPTGPLADSYTGPTGFTGYTGYTGYTGPTGFSNTGPNPEFDTVIIDSTNTEALLIRKDGDTGDIMTVDTNGDQTDMFAFLTVDNIANASTGPLHVISNSGQSSIAQFCRNGNAAQGGGLTHLIIADSSGNGYRETVYIVSGGSSRSRLDVWDGAYYSRFIVSNSGAGIGIPGSSINNVGGTITWSLSEINDIDNGFNRESSTSFSCRTSDVARLTVSDADLVATVPTYMPTYTVAGLPTGVAGQLVYVSDDTGGPVTAYYDGTNWRRMSDGVIVS